MNYVYFKENNRYVKVNNVTGKIKLRRDYPYWYIPEATEKQMIYLKMMWKYAKDIESALWFGSKNNIICDRLTGGTSEMQKLNKKESVS